MKHFIQDFLSFYIRYWGIIFVIIPLTIVFGFITPYINLVFLPVAFIFYWIRKSPEGAFTIYYLSLLIGDRLDDIGESVRHVRAILTIFLFVISISEIIKGKYKLDKTIFIWIPFFIVAIIGVIRSPILPASIMKTSSYFFMLFAAFHTFRYHIFQSKGKVLLIMMNTITFSLIISMILFLLIPSWVMTEHYSLDDGHSKELRLSGLMGNPNGLGLVCAINLIFLFYNRYFWKNISLLYTLFVVLLSIVLLLLSGSRSPLLGLLAFFSLILLNTQTWLVRNSIKYLVFPLSIYLFIKVGFDIIASNPFLATRFRISKGASMAHLTSGRTATWIFLFSVDRISKWREWFLFGKGMGFDKEFFVELYHKFPTLGRGYYYTYNTFVSIIMNNGIIGLFFMMVNIIYYHFRFKDKFIRQPSFIFMFITGMAEATLCSSLSYYPIIFFTFLALHITGHPQITNK